MVSTSVLAPSMELGDLLAEEGKPCAAWAVRHGQWKAADAIRDDLRGSARKGILTVAVGLWERWLRDDDAEALRRLSRGFELWNAAECAECAARGFAGGDSCDDCAEEYRVQAAPRAPCALDAGALARLESGLTLVYDAGLADGPWTLHLKGWSGDLARACDLARRSRDYHGPVRPGKLSTCPCGGTLVTLLRS